MDIDRPISAILRERRVLEIDKAARRAAWQSVWCLAPSPQAWIAQGVELGGWVLRGLRDFESPFTRAWNRAYSAARRERWGKR